MRSAGICPAAWNVAFYVLQIFWDYALNKAKVRLA